LAVSWGASGGVYVSNRYCKRICLGPLALTFIPDVEIDDLMESYVREYAPTDQDSSA